MKYVADIHLHSKYSRATSKRNEVRTLAAFAALKGVDILGTADFTHPKWFSEILKELEDRESSGLYSLKSGGSRLKFILSTEISLIWSQGGKVRKNHLIVLAPSLKTAAKIAAMFDKIGNIHSDGRPIFGLSSREALARILEVDSRCEVIPAHIWTPWFSLFGANSGFDSIKDAFGDLTSEIKAVETGLSSDPPMNWRVSELDDFSLISGGDAHSPANLMREATVFELQNLSYDSIVAALANSSPDALSTQKANPHSESFRRRDNFIAYTVEFFPEEGRYHADGHEKCGVKFDDPQESISLNNICPSCGKELTVGVLHRVNELADRPIGGKPKKTVPYKKLVPLEEIIAEALAVGRKSKKVGREYDKIVRELGSELIVLESCPLDKLKKVAGYKITEGVRKVRAGDVKTEAGFDGVYGKVRIFSAKKRQRSLF